MKHTSKQKALAGIGFSIFMVLSGSLLPLVLIKTKSSINNTSLYGLEAVAAGGLGLQFLIYLTKSVQRPLKLYMAAAILVVPCLALAV